MGRFLDRGLTTSAKLTGEVPVSSIVSYVPGMAAMANRIYRALREGRLAFISVTRSGVFRAG